LTRRSPQLGQAQVSERRAASCSRVRAGFVANTRINRHDFGVSRNDVVEKGRVVVGKTIDITIDAEAKLDGPDDARFTQSQYR
jgi:hypothetical protein